MSQIEAGRNNTQVSTNYPLMQIAEIFHSIQGEGQLAGTPSVFVRTSGCNLRCWYCDTPYTSWKPEGVQRNWEDVLTETLNFDCEHVVLTGGEPFLQAEIVPFTSALCERGVHLTIETAGTIILPVEASLMSISPKMQNSIPLDDATWKERHSTLRDQPAVIRQMVAKYDYQIKFVIDAPEDLADVESWLKRYPEIETTQVMLMPQARTAEELAERTPWLKKISAERGFQFSPRMHIELWGNVRGK